MLTIVKIDIISTIVTTLQATREELCAWRLILKAWIAKQKILEWLFGTHEESFQNPRRMLLVIKDSNPRMIVTWDYKMVDGNKTTFKEAFWAFDASIDGFQLCHPLISIDNTRIYSKYKAKLLIQLLILIIWFIHCVFLLSKKRWTIFGVGF